MEPDEVLTAFLLEYFPKETVAFMSKERRLLVLESDNAVPSHLLFTV